MIAQQLKEAEKAIRPIQQDLAKPFRGRQEGRQEEPQQGQGL
jgi:hypothetical protein